MLVSRISALGTRPVSPDYLDKHQLRGLSLEHTNAMAYANAARNLLSSPAEQALSPAPGRRVDSGHQGARVSRPAT